MTTPPPLSTLGPRIMVMGPSNAGKSTLATALGHRLDLPIVHLDQLSHLPNTDWEPRPKDEFAVLHDQAIEEERWVMDGNYSRLIPRRFERATSVILITSNQWLRLARYFKRTLAHPSARLGQLEGGQENLKWMMVDWILFKTPRNAKCYTKMIEATSLPAIYCKTAKDLTALYDHWDMEIPTA
ncbi:MAG: AAA family ATPase [Pseudomonadota bacterium]